MQIDINNKTKQEINLKIVENVIKKFLIYFNKKKYSVSLAFVSDGIIKKINKKYRRKEQITDILSFNGEGNFLGEIIIDYAQIKRQAKRFNNSFEQELVYILVHGLIHLLGYEDKNNKSKLIMEKIEEKFLKINKLI